ncbi:MAG: hypothetical protein WDM85_13070 [Caulobacteraceae bacterium]
MQVGSSTTLSQELQALGSAALDQYQGGGDFSFTVGDTGDSSAGAGAAGAANLLSGTFKPESLVAVGTMTPDGQLVPFSAAQVQSEENMVANMSHISYADSLQNFLALAQAGSANGQAGASSYSDQQQFVGDNGLVSANFDTSFSLNLADGAEQTSSSTSRQSITV